MNVRETVEKMSLKDKISLCMGENFWQTKAFEKYGIPSLFMCDGPNGLRKQDIKSGTDNLGVNDSHKATCYPAACIMADSWDKQLEEELGRRIGQDAKQQKVGMVLGPGINIKRNPLCGRNFEYFSEDPVVAGKMGAAFIRGLQSEGIACSLKHFACNSQEYSRFTSNGIIDERTLNEIYLKGFEIAVKEADPKCVMSSYPLINGEHCSDSRKLLDDILRKQWGFKGMVVTDWGGMNDRIKAMTAGNDLTMPGGSDYMEKQLEEAVGNGSLDEKYIDSCCERILNLVFSQMEVLKQDYQADYQDNHRFALKGAEEGAVLLKNNGVLPLKEEEKVLVVGAMAKNIRYQGAGSSHVNPMQLCQPLDYFVNYEYAQGCDDNGDTTEQLLNEISEKADSVDRIVVFAGLPDRYESEGFDRDDMFMPEGHVRMIEQAGRTGKKTVVVLCCGCVVDCGWENSADALLYMGLAGQVAGQAAVNLLYGRANPSGKLTESWPMKYEDVICSSFYKQKDALYKEGIYVGYRYYDKAGIQVRYPFGYGLSYSNFVYENFRIEGDRIKGTVRNESDVTGKEIIQLYLSQKDSPVFRPEKELKDFVKVEVKAHGSAEVEFEISDEWFKVFADGWKKCKGDYIISIGRSSRQIEAWLQLSVEGEEISQPEYLKDSWYETLKGEISDDIWMKLLGYRYEPAILEKGKFTLENTVMEMKEYSLIMKIMYKSVEMVIAKGLGCKIDYDNPEFRMMMVSSAGGPLRSMMISGGINGGIFPGLLEMANGHFFRGIITMIRG